MSRAAPPQPTATLRRFPWWRLVTLLIAMTVIAVWLGGCWSQSARRQRDAVAALKAVGAVIGYDYQEQQFKEPPLWPAWLVHSLGIDYFANVEVVQLYQAQISDNSLLPLQRLPRVKWLNLRFTPVTDASLAHLKDLAELKVLVLNDTIITDAGLEHLQGLTALTHLFVKRTKVTPAGVARLQRVLPHCKIAFDAAP